MRPPLLLSLLLLSLLLLGAAACDRGGEKPRHLPPAAAAPAMEEAEAVPQIAADLPPLPEVDPGELPFARFVVSGDVEQTVDDGEALLQPGEAGEEGLVLSLLAHKGIGAVPTARVSIRGLPLELDEATLFVLGPPTAAPAGRRLPASVVLESDRVGTLRDFIEGVSGRLEARRRGDLLEGRIHLRASEAPPPPADPAGPPVAAPAGPLVAEPATIEVAGTFRAQLPASRPPGG